MQIANNILAHALKNVYWVLGGACGGKTTLAQNLSEKYDLIHYNADEMMWPLKQWASHAEQPAMTRHFTDWEEYFGRPADMYAKWLHDMEGEALGMHVAELIRLSADKMVVFEGGASAAAISSVAPHHQIVFLAPEEEVVRQAYFEREDKDDMYQLIKTLSEPQAIIDKIRGMVIEANQRQQLEAELAGLRIFRRGMSGTAEDMLKRVEQHFRGLPPNSTKWASAGASQDGK